MEKIKTIQGRKVNKKIVKNMFYFFVLTFEEAGMWVYTNKNHVIVTIDQGI